MRSPPDKLLGNLFHQSASGSQLIELLPRRGGGWSANDQDWKGPERVGGVGLIL